MERRYAPTNASMLMVRGPQSSGLSRDRDVVKMAEVILAHFPDVSTETAYALLRSAAKRKPELRVCHRVHNGKSQDERQ